MSEPRTASSYSIAAVSKLTGVSCHALRVWERRYGFPVPHRTPSGHRRYAAEQVERLRLIAARVRAGQAVGTVMAEAFEGDPPAPSAPRRPSEPSRPWTELLDRLAAGDLAAADAEFDRLAAGLGPLDLLEQVLDPALVEIGERWFRGEMQVYQEHCATNYLRHKIARMAEVARRRVAPGGPTVLVGTVQGDRHEGGVLIVSLLLEMAGVRVVALGTDLPAAEYQKAIDLWRPDAVAVSFVLSRNVNKRFEELARLSGAPIFVGGRSILNYRSLARRYGLTPLPGPGRPAVERLLAALHGRETAEASSAG